MDSNAEPYYQFRTVHRKATLKNNSVSGRVPRVGLFYGSTRPHLKKKNCLNCSYSSHFLYDFQTVFTILCKLVCGCPKNIYIFRKKKCVFLSHPVDRKQTLFFSVAQLLHDQNTANPFRRYSLVEQSQQ